MYDRTILLIEFDRGAINSSGCILLHIPPEMYTARQLLYSQLALMLACFLVDHINS